MLAQQELLTKQMRVQHRCTLTRLRLVVLGLLRGPTKLPPHATFIASNSSRSHFTPEYLKELILLRQILIVFGFGGLLRQNCAKIACRQTGKHESEAESKPITL